MACEEQSITVPQDIIIDILYRLPVKTLGRFRCVSKEWLSLLSEPHFIHTHHKTLNRNHLIFWSKDGSLCSVPFDDLESVSALPKLPFESIRYCDILCSCNGLVLASDCGSFNDFAVFNLTTKEYVKFERVIPHAFTYNATWYHYDFSKTGFGYDSLSDDYKVVFMSYFRSPSAIPPFKIRVHVYSLRSITWKQVSDSPYDHYDWEDSLRWSSGVFVNEFIHWIASKGSDSIQVIAAFSLAEEKFISEVPPPDLYNDVDILQSGNYCKLVALGEKLAIFNSVKGDDWLMNEYGVQKSWTKIVFGEYYRFPGVEPQIFYDNGKIMIAHNRMWMYDLEEKTVCKTGDFNNLNLRRVISTCVESLVSPKLADPVNYPQMQGEDLDPPSYTLFK